MKDIWRDNHCQLEGELYTKIGPCKGVAEVHSYGIVQIERNADTTSHLIRFDLLLKVVLEP